MQGMVLNIFYGHSPYQCIFERMIIHTNNIQCVQLTPGMDTNYNKSMFKSLVLDTNILTTLLEIH